MQTPPQKLPVRGIEMTLTAHGKSLLIRKNSSGHDWNAKIVGSARVRFGNAREIREDIEYFMQSGALPEARNSWC